MAALHNYEITEATFSDNHELLQLVRNHPVSATGLSYCLDRSPDYFALNQLQGYDWKVMVARNEKLLGAVSVVFDHVFLEGKAQNVAYTGELRVDKTARGTGVSDALMRAATYACFRNGQSMPIFTAVMQDNPAGLKKNANLARDNITNMQQVGEIISYFLLPFTTFPWQQVYQQQYYVRRATEGDLPAMYVLWHKINQHKNLARHFQTSTFNRWLNQTPDLHISDFFLVFEKQSNTLQAFLGIWRQTKLRQVIVSRETRALQIIRQGWNYSRQVLKLPAFPQPGEKLNFHSVVNLCVPAEKPAALGILLQAAMRQARASQSLFLAMALDKKDPLNRTVKKFAHSASKLYLLSNYPFKDVNSQLFHVEIALG